MSNLVHAPEFFKSALFISILYLLMSMPKHIKTATTEIGVQSEFEIIWYVFQKIKLSIE